MQGDGFHSGNTAVEMYPRQNRPSSPQSGHQKRAERSEKRDSRWRHIHAPWIAEGKLCHHAVFMFFETDNQDFNNLTMKMSSPLKANEQIHQENFGRYQTTD